MYTFWSSSSLLVLKLLTYTYYHILGNFQMRIFEKWLVGKFLKNISSFHHVYTCTMEGLEDVDVTYYYTLESAGYYPWIPRIAAKQHLH